MKYIYALLSVLGVMSLAVMTGCNQPAADPDAVDAVKAGAVNTNVNAQPKFSVQVLQGTTPIYDEKSSATGFAINAGVPYVLRFSAADVTAGASLSMQIGSGAASSLAVGDNILNIPLAGAYTITIRAVKNGVTTTKSYTVDVACTAVPVPNPAAISVSSNGDNTYSYVANGSILTGAVGALECAWDFNGDGIIDTIYRPCNTAVQAYSAYVENRPQLGVFVRDLGCFKVTKVTAPRTLTPPAYAGLDTYVHAVVSSSIASNQRTNFTHVSTNLAAPQPVSCSYQRSNGVGTFAVSTQLQYGNDASGKPHGIRFTIPNIVDTVQVSNGVLTGGDLVVPASENIPLQLSVDQGMDQSAQNSYSGSCAATNLDVTPMNATGNPCSTTGYATPNRFTVLVHGNFSCSGMPAAIGSESVNITGDFSCLYHFGDDCVGGGGGGGGVPVAYF